MNTDQVNDSVFEALFCQAVIDNYIEEINAIPSNEELSKIYTFSPKFELRMKKLFAREERRERFIIIAKYAKRVAAVFVIGIMVLFGTLLFNPEVRAAVQKVIIQWYEQFTSFTFTNGLSSDADTNMLYTGYLPDVFKKHETGDLNTMTYVIFLNSVDDEIRIKYSQADNINLSVDNENHLVEEYTVNGRQAFAVTAISDKFENGVIFDSHGFVIEIWSSLSIDELMKMAEATYMHK